MKVLTVIALLICVAVALAETHYRTDVLVEEDALVNSDDTELEISEEDLERFRAAMLKELSLQDAARRGLGFWRRRRRRRGGRRRSGGKYKVTTKCEENSCTVCMKIHFIKVCAHVTSEESEGSREFKFEMKINGYSIKTIEQSVTDTTPFCVKKGITACIELYDYKIESGKIHICLKMTKPIEFNIKCVSMGEGMREKRPAIDTDVAADMFADVAPDSVIAGQADMEFDVVD